MAEKTLVAEINAIERHFSFLLEDSFEVGSAERFEHFGNWVVHLDSAQVRLIISQDRGGIMLLIGPSSAASTGLPSQEYIGLEIVLAYLTGDHSYYPYLLQDVHGLDAQLAKLAEITKTHWPLISGLFGRNYSASRGKTMKLLGEQLFEKHFHPVKPDYEQILLDLIEILRALAASRSVQKKILPSHVPVSEELRAMFKHSFAHGKSLKDKGLINETSLRLVEKIDGKFREMNLNSTKDWQVVRFLALETLNSMGKSLQPPIIGQHVLERRVEAYGSLSERMRLQVTNIALIVAVSISIAHYIYSLAGVDRAILLLALATLVVLILGVIVALLHSRVLLRAQPIRRVLDATSLALVFSWLFHVLLFCLIGLMGISWRGNFVHILLFLVPFVMLLIATLVVSALDKERSKAPE
ncbi:MAG: hypothetical protein KIT70_09795 [Anaerolineales bacterium]|nr:MAG: hypothetical protein KIT70_09795 [Anaerolineales bacterium]